ncbi:potassium channel protein [Anaerolineales bacterium HSG6]|nr:potassium channel protein [Anaerolineales bacterium HSG6]
MVGRTGRPSPPHLENYWINCSAMHQQNKNQSKLNKPISHSFDNFINYLLQNKRTRALAQFINRLREDFADFRVFVRHVDTKSELFIALVFFIGFSTGGYMLIEGWPLLDSLYMVMITMSTIGYGEVKQLSMEGRLFTIWLIIIGVIVASYTISATIETLTSEGFHRERRKFRRRRQLRRIENHTIICGYGRMGRSLARELKERGAPVIVIDVDPQAIDTSERRGIPSIEGNATDEELLYEAGIERAKALVAAAKSDAENVFIVLSARGINEKLDITARCNFDTSVSKMKRAGADIVVSPYKLAGRHIAQQILTPRVTRFLDGVLHFGQERLRLEDFIIHKQSLLAGKTLKEAQLDVNVLAVSRSNQEIISHPTADTILLPGMEIVVIGLDEQLKEVARLVCG